MSFVLRTALLADEPALRRLIPVSIRTLGAPLYSSAQIEAALQGAFGLDTSLIRDGTYLVAVDGEELIGCGGWSRRRTLFGSDDRPDRDQQMLDPAVDAARIRAFFVHPGRARHGVGRALLARCEADAARAGFRRFELMATLPGVPLYERAGYVGEAPIRHPLPGGLDITFVPMRKGS